MKHDLKQNIKMQLVTSLHTSPVTYVPHYHFSFVDEILGELCTSKKDEHRLMMLDSISILEFDLLKGIVRDFTTKEIHDYYTEYKDLGKWLEYLVFPGKNPPTMSNEKPVVCLFKNIFTEGGRYPLETFLLKFVANYSSPKGVSLLIVDPTPVASLPSSIRDIMSVVEISKPKMMDLENIVNSLPVSLICEGRKDRLRSDLCRNLQGLDLYETLQVIRSSVFRSNGTLNDSTSMYALEEKRRILQKSGIIEVIPTEISFNDIGGLERLRKDISRSANLYKHLDAVEACGVPLPKGILVLGMPGCGKSMIAKAAAKEFGVSLLRLDVSRLMGKYVGESEANLRSALETAEAAHPCVLWIDEIEKAFSGAGTGGGESDMLVMRMMGHFLTWMQERKTAVYIVATANDAMRPEFMRKGRFDQIYFVDFPNEKERLEILKKKLAPYRKAKYLKLDSSLDDASKELEKLSDIMHHFAGAEIEAVVSEVMSRTLCKAIEKTEDGDEMKPVEVKKEDFEDIINEQRNSIMYEQGKKRQSSPINAIRRLYEEYKFPSASEKNK